MAKELTAGQKRRQARKANLENVVAFIEKNAEGLEIPADVVASAAALKPGQRGAVRVGMKDVVSSLFVNVGDTVSENEIWENHKLGRSEMRKNTNNLIKKPEPADRKWIDFDSEAGVYELKGIGPNPPAGWTGYVPATLEVIDEDDYSDDEDAEDETDEDEDFEELD